LVAVSSLAGILGAALMKLADWLGFFK
jgi:hypothetical protein